MGLLDFFARKKAVSASPAVLEAAADRRVSFMPLIATPSEAFNPRIRDAFVEVQSGTYGWIYAHQPAVRTVIDYIARNAAQLGLSLYERVGDNDRKEVGDHPAAESLRYPNPRQRTRALVYNLAIEWLIYDNAYALIVEGEAGRVQLLPVPAPRVGVLGPENYSVDAYRIWRRDGTWFDWPTESMLHWAGFDPEDPRRGVSRLETLRQLLAEDRASQAANTEVLQSGLLKPGYLKRPLDAPPLDVTDATRIVEDWQAAIKAPGRRTAMLEEGTEFEDFGITPRDAEMLEGRRFTREEVSALYGMDTCPPENAEDRQIFFSDVLQPLMRLFCETLDRSVLEQQYGLTDHYFQAGLDEQMESEKLKALTAASGRPVLLTDEARAALDLPPVEGGDELVTPANVIVGNNPKPSPMVMPIQDPNKPSQEGDHRGLSASEQIRAVENGNRAVLDTKQLEVTNEPRRDADRRRQMRYIDEMKALLARHYARQRKTLVSPTANKAAGDEALWLRWTEELGRDLVKLLKSITDREANIYVSRLGGIDFDMREVDHYLTAMAEGTADGINGATQRDIADAGAEEAFNRADMRTEVAATGIGTRATVFARKEAGRQAPNPEQRLKIWIANSERHQDLDGVTVPLEGDWGGIVPGSEPNCSCAMEVV